MALPSIGQRVLERSILQNKQRQIQIEGLTGGQVFEQPIFIVLLDCFRHADSMDP